MGVIPESKLSDIPKFMQSKLTAYSLINLLQSRLCSRVSILQRCSVHDEAPVNITDFTEYYSYIL